MTTPKKPLSKTESAIQLGNVLKYAAGGRGGKLRKIGEKAIKSASPIKEVKKAKKSLQNQKVVKPSKSANEVKANAAVFKRFLVGQNLRTHSGGIASELGAAKRYIKARGPLTPKGREKLTGIPAATGRLLKQKRVLKNQKVKIKKDATSFEKDKPSPRSPKP